MNLLELIERLQEIAKVHPHSTVAFEIEDPDVNFSADIAGVVFDHARKKVVLE